MRLLVIGAGNGGAATAVELTLAGHDVALYARSADTIAPFAQDGIRHRGVFGEGQVRPAALGCDLGQAMKGTEAVIVALPTFAHSGVARHLNQAGWDPALPVILNPGHTGGAFEFEAAYRSVTARVPPIVEFSTLAYVARKPEPNVVNITGRAKALRAAALPGGEEALALACRLFPGAYDTGDVIASDLSNVNMVIHPPGAILGAAWVEATGGDFTFYVEGMTSGVIEVIRALDAERLAVAAALGHDLPNVIDEMKAIGTVPADADSQDYHSIAAGEANRRIKAPDTLGHRYYAEDFGHGLVPFLVYASIAGVETPVASALAQLGKTATAGLPKRAGLRDAKAMGLEGCSRDMLLRRARHGSRAS